MRSQLRPAIVSLALLILVTGVAYPLVVTGVAQVVFHRQANGSLIEQDGKVVGSELIGQAFDDPGYFWGRPSATGPFPYNAAASSGSNLGPSNEALTEAVQARIDALAAADQALGIDNTTTDPGGPGDGLGQRAGSAHQPSGGGIPSGACGECTRPGRGAGALASGRAHRRAAARVPGRAARQRAKVELGARRATMITRCLTP